MSSLAFWFIIMAFAKRLINTALSMECWRTKSWFKHYDNNPFNVAFESCENFNLNTLIKSIDWSKNQHLKLATPGSTTYAGVCGVYVVFLHILLSLVNRWPQQLRVPCPQRATLKSHPSHSPTQLSLQLPFLEHRGRPSVWRTAAMWTHARAVSVEFSRES